VSRKRRRVLSKVVLIATSSTIASRHDEALGRTVAAQRAEDLLARAPQLAEVAAIEVDDFATISGGASPECGGRRRRFIRPLP
jgi:L-asparaginase/Glu-tRNA(Gln) amidotransferase subunit D